MWDAFLLFMEKATALVKQSRKLVYALSFLVIALRVFWAVLFR